MDPDTNLPALTSDFSSSIDELTLALDPLFATPPTTLTHLAKARLNLVTAYTLESLLFSALTASGADAKSHAVFAEIARLKTYFAKVKAAEDKAERGGVEEKPSARLDKEAAARFIRHGLAGNERYDAERAERAERLAKERARAALRAKKLTVNKKFDDDAETKVQEELARKKKEAEEVESESESESSSSSELDEEDDDDITQQPETNPGSDEDHVSSENADIYGTTPSKSKFKSNPKTTSKTPIPSTKPESKPTLKPRRKRKSLPLDNAATTKRLKRHRDWSKDDEPAPGPAAAPRTHAEAFNALLAGTFVEETKKRTKKKKKSGSKREKRERDAE